MRSTVPEQKRYFFPEKDHVVHVSTAKVYRFDWPHDYSGWAIFTVCDETGEFTIQSDWGNFSHRWNVNHIGSPSLHHFLSDRPDFWYIVNKLSYDNQALKEVFDHETTLAEFRRVIIERRREYTYDKEKARDLWRLVEEFCHEMDPHGLTDSLWHNDDYEDVFKEFEDTWEYIHQCKPTVWHIVEGELLPRFAEYVREHVLPNHPATRAQSAVS